MQFCQTAPLLSSVARQQNLTEYWREGSTSTAISPTSASVVVGQHNKIGVINFGATFVVTDIFEVLAPPPSNQCVSEIILGLYFRESAKY